MPYRTMRLLTLQLFKNSIDTQGKLRLNLHSLSVSELLEYRRLSGKTRQTFASSKLSQDIIDLSLDDSISSTHFCINTLDIFGVIVLGPVVQKPVSLTLG